VNRNAAGSHTGVPAWPSPQLHNCGPHAAAPGAHAKGRPRDWLPGCRLLHAQGSDGSPGQRQPPHLLQALFQLLRSCRAADVAVLLQDRLLLLVQGLRGRTKGHEEITGVNNARVRTSNSGRQDKAPDWAENSLD
jgi:hypothetical protein